MNYLTVAISSVAKRPKYIILFILFNALGLSVSLMKQFGIVQGVLALVLMICIFAFSTFFESGVYTLSWKYMKGEHEAFVTGAKKYFPHVLAASIVIGIIAAIVVFIPLFIYKLIRLPDVPALHYHKRIDTILLRNILEFTISVIFVLCHACNIYERLVRKKCCYKFLEVCFKILF